MSRINWPRGGRVTDANNKLVNGGKVYTYQAGTTTAAPLYSDAALTQSYGNFVEADSEGFLPDAYADPVNGFKLRYFLADGVTQIGDEIDDVYPPIDGSSISQSQAALGFGTAANEDIGTSGNTVGKLNTVNTWSALQTFAAGLGLTNTSDAATAGPELPLFRDSGDPAADDLLGQIRFQGNNDAATAEKIEYANLVGKLISETDGSEYGALILRAMLNNTLTDVLDIGALDSSDTTVQGIGLRTGSFYDTFGSALYANRGWHLVEEVTAGGSDPYLTSETIPTGTNDVEYVWSVVPSADDKEIRGEVKIGGNWIQTGYQYANNHLRQGATNVIFQHNGSASYLLFDEVTASAATGNAAGEHNSGRMFIQTPLATTLLRAFEWNLSGIAATGAVRRTSGSGSLTNTGAIQGFRLFDEDGANLPSGTLRCYARK